jgi:hypothetical protein
LLINDGFAPEGRGRGRGGVQGDAAIAGTMATMEGREFGACEDMRVRVNVN